MYVMTEYPAQLLTKVSMTSPLTLSSVSSQNEWCRKNAVMGLVPGEAVGDLSRSRGRVQVPSVDDRVNNGDDLIVR